MVLLPDGSTRKLHADKLRFYISRVNALGVVFEDRREEFGNIEFYDVPFDGSDSASDDINGVNLSHLSPIEQFKLRRVLFDNRNVFSVKPGVCNLTEHKIVLRGDFKSRAQKPYRIPVKLKKEVDRQVNQLLADGKIIPAVSQYSHPVVCVTKPNGEIRLCCDFRDLNSGTIPDAFPMPRIQDMVHDISLAKYITTLDAVSGYWQIPMAKECVDMITFVTETGL